VKAVAQQRLGVDFVKEASPETALIQVSYSESSNGKKHPLDLWRDSDPVKRLIQTKGDQPEEFEVRLMLQCIATAGSVLDTTEVRYAAAPISLDFSMPWDMQFCVASLVGAAREQHLKLNRPKVKTFDPVMRNAMCSGESLPDASQPLDARPTTIPIDDALVDEGHGPLI